MSKESGIKTVAVNKKARHNYEFIDTYEAGMMLQGTEVKSLRAAHISFKDGYIDFRNGEAWLIGVHIAPYENAGYVEQDPERERKLLLHAREIEVLAEKVAQKGLSVVPVKVYFKNGRAKIEIALARGKKTHDKRDELKQRDLAKDTAREMSRY